MEGKQQDAEMENMVGMKMIKASLMILIAFKTLCWQEFKKFML